MRRALGKGLSQLIGEQFEGDGTQEVPIGAIERNPRQPRSHFDEAAIEDLAASIREHGIVQPLVVRPLAVGKYELIAGERRLRAAARAGLTEVPVIIRATGDQGSLELALIENVQREDISAIECARAYHRLVEEFGLTQEKVAEKVGKSRVAVANHLRLLRLPPAVQDALQEGKISEGHGRALLMFEDPAHQLAVYGRILDEGLTVRDVERAAKQAPEREKRPRLPKAPPAQDAHWPALEEALSIYLGSPAKLVKGEVGGKLVVEFYGDDDLERLLEVLGISL